MDVNADLTATQQSQEAERGVRANELNAVSGIYVALKPPPKPPRNSSFELLRTVAMIMIITFHATTFNSHKMDMLLTGGIRGTFITLILSLGGAGVHAFFLLTGYFLVKSEVKFKALLKIWLTVSFWAIVTLIVGVLLGVTELNFGNVMRNVLPLTMNAYWFITSYFAVVLMSVKANPLLRKIPKRTFAVCLFLAIAVIYLTGWFGDNTVPKVFPAGVNRIVPVILTYFVGAYLRLHPPKVSTAKLALLFFSWWAIALPAISYLINLKATTESNFPLCDKICFFIPSPDLIVHDVSLLTFLSGLTLFLLFMHIKIKPSRIINALGATSLGVYVIHENRNFYSWIWNNALNVYDYFSSYAIYYMPFVIGIVVFTVCAILELLRLKLYDKIENFITSKRKLARHIKSAS
jgi:hypothetical protein